MADFDSNKPQCSVEGVIRKPGMGGCGMCSEIIVGGKFCGSDEPCQFKVEPAVAQKGEQQ